MTTISIDGTALDRMVSDLREHAAAWTALPLAERIALLERMLPRVVVGAAEMAAADSRAKGLAAGSVAIRRVVRHPRCAATICAGPGAVSRPTWR